MLKNPAGVKFACAANEVNENETCRYNRFG